MSVLNKIKSEPILATSVVSAAAVLLVQLGVPIGDGVADAVTGLIVAVAALFARSKVSPTVEH